MSWYYATIIHGLVQSILRFLAHSPMLMSVVGMTMVIEAFGFGSIGLLPLFADRAILDVGASGLGIMNGAIAFGGVIGALTLACAGELRAKGKLLLWFFLFQGLVAGGFSQSNHFALSLLLLTGWGIVIAIYSTTSVLVLQQYVPDEMRGRAMGAWTVTVGADTLGALFLGFLALQMGVQNAVGLAGVIMVAATIFAAAAMPQLRTLR